MPTRELLPMTYIDRDGLRQDPTKGLDLDGFGEVALYLNAQSVTNGGGTLTVRVAHAYRNRASDYTELDSFTVTSDTTDWSYQTEFSRYLTLKAEWSGSAGSTAEADVELLVVPKK